MPLFPGRYSVHDRIQQLDPVTDHQEIVYLVGSYESPWLIRKALEFALFRTYAVPHTSRILQATGQFEAHGQKRYDDTTLMLAGIAEYGYDSDYGRKAIERMNMMHGHWHIANRDMLYVLSTFIYEPVRWHEKYNWRAMTETEKLANYYFWVEVGKRMGIQDIPATYDAYEQFNIDHERKFFDYAHANKVIGEATMRVFTSRYPLPLRPLVEEVAKCFMDDKLLYAFGFSKPHSALRRAVKAGLWAGIKVQKFFPPRSKPYSYISQEEHQTYPEGFEVEKLGVFYDEGTDPDKNAEDTSVASPGG